MRSDLPRSPRLRRLCQLGERLDHLPQMILGLRCHFDEVQEQTAFAVVPLHFCLYHQWGRLSGAWTADLQFVPQRQRLRGIDAHPVEGDVAADQYSRCLVAKGDHATSERVARDRSTVHVGPGFLGTSFFHSAALAFDRRCLD